MFPTKTMTFAKEKLYSVNFQTFLVFWKVLCTIKILQIGSRDDLLKTSRVLREW